ncbi:PIN domain-containing protein [Streptomyces sp. NPDC060005]|uniref:PIN domain-containing protein n=1 Tax=Streptomyces sp. NPDC060005 TaxID=3347034 RepID=UPI00367BB26F
MSSFLRGFDGLWARPTEDYRGAVKEYLIVVDTNVLLELYRFTPQARLELLDVLDQLGQRLWVPHQVVKEYHKRRFDAVREHLNLYTSVPENLKSLRKKALQEVQNLANRCSMSDADKQLLTAPIDDAFDQVSNEIQRHSDAFDLSLAKVVRGDPILSTLARVLDGKTGDPFSDEEETTLISTFQERAAEQIPPGYRDASKAENAHGDFFVWEQLLREAKKRQTPVLLVTNDVKPDWVQKEAGFTVGARPELLAEFGERCDRDFLMTQLPYFLSMAKEVLGAAVSQSTMQQAKNVRLADVTEMLHVTLPQHLYQSVLNGLADDFEEDMKLPLSRFSAEDREAHRTTEKILQAMAKSGRRRPDGDTSFSIPADCFPFLRDYLTAFQNSPENEDENGNNRSEYRLLLNELSSLRELLEMARAEREAAQSKAAEIERAVRDADTNVPDDVRKRLAREAEATRRHLNSAMIDVHDIETQIAAISEKMRNPEASE